MRSAPSMGNERRRRVKHGPLIVSLVLSLVICSSAVEAEAPAPAASKLQLLTRFFETEVATNRIPGAVVLIQQHGRPVYLKTFGVRDVKTHRPMTTDTIFALRSMTKPITSVAAMMLVDAGKMSLDDPIAKYIPSFAEAKVAIETRDAPGKLPYVLVPPVRQPTIRDLLLQTSGIAGEYVGGWVGKLYEQGQLFEGRFNNADLADRLSKLPITRQPGTFWRYGYSSEVLGRIIEVASGKTLFDFMKQNLFDPLGMTHTKFVLNKKERLLMAAPLPNDTNLIEQERSLRSHPEWESGGGGLVSTITDYARFAQMLLNGGTLDGKRYLSAVAFQDMTTDHIGPGSGVNHDYLYFPGDGFGYGYGLAVRTGPGEKNQPGSIGELKWDSLSGTYVGIDRKLDMLYLLMEQVDNQRGPIRVALRKLVYDAFPPDNVGRTTDEP
jgi:CubicO group peptidase (beta-lactamase class C family)